MKHFLQFLVVLAITMMVVFGVRKASHPNAIRLSLTADDLNQPLSKRVREGLVSSLHIVDVTPLRRGKVFLLRLLIKNVERKKIHIDGRISAASHLSFQIRDEKSQEIGLRKMTVQLYRIRREDFTTLLPGHLHGVDFPLDTNDLRPNRKGHLFIRVDCSLWENGQDFGIQSWTGTLNSNVIVIDIS